MFVEGLLCVRYFSESWYFSEFWGYSHGSTRYQCSWSLYPAVRETPKMNKYNKMTVVITTLMKAKQEERLRQETNEVLLYRR